MSKDELLGKGCSWFEICAGLKGTLDVLWGFKLVRIWIFLGLGQVVVSSVLKHKSVGIVRGELREKMELIVGLSSVDANISKGKDTSVVLVCWVGKIC